MVWYTRLDTFRYHQLLLTGHNRLQALTIHCIMHHKCCTKSSTLPSHYLSMSVGLQPSKVSVRRMSISLDSHKSSYTADEMKIKITVLFGLIDKDKVSLAALSLPTPSSVLHVSVSARLAALRFICGSHQCLLLSCCAPFTSRCSHCVMSSPEWCDRPRRSGCCVSEGICG